MAARHPPDPDEDVLDIDAAALHADVLSVDTLARISLAARREGRDVRLRDAPAPLCELLAFLGLAEACGLGLGLEPQRQAEQREQPLGVEERVDRGDGAV